MAVTQETNTKGDGAFDHLDWCCRGQSEECGGEAPPTQGQPEGADGDKTTDRGRTTPHPGRPQRPRVPAPRARQRPRAGPAHHRGELSPPQTANRGGTVSYPPQPPPPPPRSQLHAPQPREGQEEAHVGPPAKGAPRDGREADSRAGPDPQGRGGASGPRTQPRGAPERGPPTSRSVCARRRPPPGKQTAAHHSTFREVRHDGPQPCLPDTPQTERRGPDPPRPATLPGHHCCPHSDRQSQHGRGVSRNRALRSAPTTTTPHPRPPGHMPQSHPPLAKKGATRPGQGHAMAPHERRRGGGPDTPTPDQKGPQSKAAPRVPPTMPPPRDGGRTSPPQSAAGAKQHAPPPPSPARGQLHPPAPRRPQRTETQSPYPHPQRGASPARAHGPPPQPLRAPQAKVAASPQIHPDPRRADPQPPRDGRPRATNPHRPPDTPNTPDARPAAPQTDQGRHSHQPP
ncbi:proline-rich protein 2-like [Solea solea]|uniref:proline-rich protein 2-like n=1 Tax=Solea solea TaxID=90069 RepID=UPI00272ABBC1|nr:proline-rich protein 2-like [Solea solea]